ncbi:hypothetical protein Vi05172_g7351 [Venturia inaequalis]|nr:hypothetical protein Vi05172_g7351 [Venturia inaequalis]
MDVEPVYIELPGEANPLNRDALIRNLVLGTGKSANTQELQTATKQLEKWQAQSEFYLQLQSVFVDQGLPFEVRYLAVLQLLNAITNKQAWGKNRSQGVNDQDKNRIRSQLLVSTYREPDDRLARQNALIIAKVVRQDFPREWPDVFDHLEATINGQFDASNPVHLLQMRRALEILQAVVKELSKASLKISIIRSKAPSLLPPLVSIFNSCSQSFANQPCDSFTVDDANAIALLLPCTGIIRRLLVKGFERPHREETSVQAWAALQSFWAQRVRAPHPAGNGELNSSKKMLEKCILQIAKLQLDMAEDNPASAVLFQDAWRIPLEYTGLAERFAQTYGVGTSEELQIGTHGDAAEDGTPFLEKFALKGLLIIRACLRIVANPRSIKARTDQDKAEQVQVVQILQENVFTLAYTQSCLELIISRYFVFKPSDLRRWEEEPDEWEAAEGGDAEGYRYSIRLATEKLFLDLANKYTEFVVPTILGLVRRAAESPLDVMQKESIYTALGLAADRIHVYCQRHQPQAESPYNFNDTLPSLVKDLQNRDPSYRLIRRRIAILLGKWYHIQVSEENRPLVYQIFQHLLDKDDALNDLVVRVTAGRQLKEVASDWEFKAVGFLPYASDTLSRVMNLIAEVDLPETKMGLLETISVLVEQMETHIAPFADRIVSILPALWDETGEETLRKQVIVTLLSNLFKSMGTESGKFQSFALFIIKAVAGSGASASSTLPAMEKATLLPETLELWKSVLDNSPNTTVDQLQPDLLELLRTSLIPTLEMDSEDTQAALEITSAYFLLIPKEFLSEQTFVVEVLKTQANALRTLRPEASYQVFEVVELLVRAADNLAGPAGVQSVARAMVDAGFFRELIMGLRESWEAHQTSGPKASVSNVQGQVETDFFVILARILYASPEVFTELVGTITGNTEEVMKWLLEEWFSHAQDLVTSPERHKLMAMALSRLLALNQPYMLSRLQQMMDLWVSVIESLTEGNEDKSVDSLVYPPPVAPVEGASAGAARKAVLQDPVHQVNLNELVRHVVSGLVEHWGAERFQQEWLVNVDKEIIEQFGKLGVA